MARPGASSPTPASRRPSTCCAARAEPLGIELVVAPLAAATFDARTFGAIVQTPDEAGCVHDLRDFMSHAKAHGVLVAVGTDLLSLALLTPPGEIGADVAFGSAQRFGVPMGYGGPHAAFFATLESTSRQTPGRLVGVSVDAHGDPAYRMALQTREQHIRRDRATSNICTAQALLANIAGLYAVYHGPNGLTEIARRVHGFAGLLERELAAPRRAPIERRLFRHAASAHRQRRRVRDAALASGLNFRYRPTAASTSLSTKQPARAMSRPSWRPLGGARETRRGASQSLTPRRLPTALARTTPFLTHPVFSAHRSETNMMRYLRRLERKDIGLDTSMIPLGSCTMKLNAASEMLPLTWPAFSSCIRSLPWIRQTGYHAIFRELEAALCEITGFAAVSLQPNSGAQGEFTGLMVIRAYHRDRGEAGRDVVLIPASAHGTNPASAVMAGMRVVVVASRAGGGIDLDDLGRQGRGTPRPSGCVDGHLPVDAGRLRG